MGGGRVSILCFIGIFAVGVILFTSGSALLSVFAIRYELPRHALEFVVGTAAGGVFVAVVSMVFKISALKAFLCYSMGTAVLISMVRPTPVTLNNRRLLFDIFVFAGLAALAIYWASPFTVTLPTLLKTNHLVPATDYYIHASGIAQLGGPVSAGRGQITMVESPLVLYHYAFLSIAAVLQGFVAVPPIGLASSFLFPFGIFLLLLGTYLLGTSLSSRMSGVVAAFLLLFLPNFSAAVLGNDFLSVHWWLDTHPGLGYGIGIALVATSLIVDGSKHCRRLTVSAGLVLASTTFAFAVQIFIVFFGSVLSTAVVGRLYRAQNSRNAINLAIIAALTMVLAIIVIPVLRDAWLTKTDTLRFAVLVHEAGRPTRYDAVTDWLFSQIPPVLAIFASILLVAPIALAIPLIMYVAAILASKPRYDISSLNLFPAMSVLCFVVMMVTLPGNPLGPLFDLKLRPFPFAYAVLLIWSVSLLSDKFVKRAALGATAPRSSVLAIVGTVILLLIINPNAPRTPRFSWAPTFYDDPLPDGFVQVSAYAFAHRSKGDLAVLLPVDPKANLHDSAVAFVALAEMPMYLARAGIYEIMGSDFARIASERLRFLDSIASSSDSCTSFFALEQRGVTWLVTLPAKVQFDPLATNADFRAGEVAIYNVRNAIARQCVLPSVSQPQQ